VLIDDRLSALLAHAGLPDARGATRMPGGGNNRLFRVDTKQGQVVLKAYFHHPDDPRDRLGAEFGFAQFAWTHGIRNIPQPLAANAAEHVGLYAFVDGHRTALVGDSAVGQALDFVAQLNVQRAHGRGLPNASAACFSLDQHLERIDARVARLDDVEDDQARDLVTHTLQPAWHSLRALAVAAAADLGISPTQILPSADRCISPSDFGFHNALVDARGDYWFLDFEYGGWDDPAKLVCDFFCQPACPVPLAYFERVVAHVSGWFREPAWHAQRMRLLWPVYQFNWACIVLNEFLPVASRRRRFAGADASQRGQRLERSRTFARHALEDAAQLAA
jgi:hypothetical protein